MPRRVANVLLGAGVLGLVATGLAGWLLPFEPALALFDLHRALGAAALLVVAAWKWRIAARSLRRRLVRPPGAGQGYDRTVWGGLTAAALLVGAFGLGLAWTLGLLSYQSLRGYSPLNLHVYLGLALVPALLPHLLQRWEGWPRPIEARGRRTALRALGLSIGALALWRGLEALAASPGRRMTGSKHAGSFSGNAYPVTIWTFDGVPAIDREGWRLKVLGKVERPGEIGYDELAGSFPARERAITLDCTGGWWSEQLWRGVALRDVLVSRGPLAGARGVDVRSLTGHSWSFRIDELDEALLATHVGGEELTPGHGYPVRLAVPGRRGFQWVKWVDRVEVY
ncbi:MAG TPA: molybdopterin-dependent oxidoreductase [Chloroflexota bacterium]